MRTNSLPFVTFSDFLLFFHCSSHGMEWYASVEGRVWDCAVQPQQSSKLFLFNTEYRTERSSHRPITVLIVTLMEIGYSISDPSQSRVLFLQTHYIYPFFFPPSFSPPTAQPLFRMLHHSPVFCTSSFQDGSINPSIRSHHFSPLLFLQDPIRSLTLSLFIYFVI